MLDIWKGKLVLPKWWTVRLTTSATQYFFEAICANCCQILALGTFTQMSRSSEVDVESISIEMILGLLKANHWFKDRLMVHPHTHTHIETHSKLLLGLRKEKAFFFFFFLHLTQEHRTNAWSIMAKINSAMASSEKKLLSRKISESKLKISWDLEAVSLVYS